MQIQAVFPYWPLYRAAWIFLRANPQNTRKVVSSDPSDPLYVFRMSTLLWALTVLQHETLKQQLVFFKFPGVFTTPLSRNANGVWDIPQRGDHSGSSSETEARDAESFDFAAPSVSKRVWPPTQVTPWKHDSLHLQFKSSSQPQTLSWPPSLEWLD